jgi:hypothetical protein
MTQENSIPQMLPEIIVEFAMTIMDENREKRKLTPEFICDNDSCPLFAQGRVTAEEYETVVILLHY